MMKNISMKLASYKFDIGFFLFLLVLPLLFYWRYFSGDMSLVSGDGYGFFANRQFVAYSLLEGDFPLWNKYLSNGVPYVADISNNAFYPISLALSFFPTKIYMYAFFSLHWAIGGFFTYRYLLEIDCGKLSAMLTAILYEFSIHLHGPRKEHIMILVTIVYLPVILYFMQKYINTNRIKWLYGTSVVMALQVYTAFIQDVVYTDIAVFVYLMLMFLVHKTPIKRAVSHTLQWLLLYAGLIALQIIPTAELLATYSSQGSSSMDMNMFQSYSIHFTKLIQMVFPNFWGDGGQVYMKYGHAYSSELDVELFLGVLVLGLAIVAATRFFRDLYVKIAVLFAGVAFLFAAQAHVPFLSRLFYHIPVINMFRVPSRVLFIFIFFVFVLFAIAFSKLQDADNLPLFHRPLLVYALAILSVTALAILPNLVANAYQNADDRQQVFYSYAVKAFACACFIAAGILLLLWLAPRAKKIIRGHYATFYIACGVLLLTGTLMETQEFRGRTYAIALDTFYDTTNPVQDTLGYGKIWDAFPGISGGHTSMVSHNKAIITKTPSINAYISFNNPRLFRLFSQKEAPMNFSGLMTGSVDAERNLHFQNDLLSMLGVKYIVDSYGLLETDRSIHQLTGAGTTIYQADMISIPSSQETTLFISGDTVPVKPGTYYRIEFDFEAATEPELLYVDLYGGEMYDNSEQDVFFTEVAESSHQTGYLYSGDSTVVDSVLLRIVCIPASEALISNFRFIELEGAVTEDAYIPFAFDGDTPIYENTTARDILYIPETVQSIDSIDRFYDEALFLDLSQTSYVEDFKHMDLKGNNSQITVSNYSNNAIQATVFSEREAFLNFSQNHYPGWIALVNGEKVPLYLVNGLIQGIELPAGTCTVEFRYVPKSILLGAVITALTLAAIIAALILSHKKEKSSKKGKFNEDNGQPA